MKIGPAGLALIKSFESLRLEAYLPTPDDVPTIGYGHTEGVQMGDVWTEAEADAALLEDVAKFEACVEKAVNVPMRQNEFDACVSLAFNIGCKAFRDSTLVRMLNDGENGAADQFLRWDKQAGKRLRGLTRRREAERDLFTREDA